jgi:hypothetical protein
VKRRRSTKTTRSHPSARKFKYPKFPAELPDLESLFRVWKRNIRFMLLDMRLAFEDEGNPIYAWRALDYCIKNDTNFPDWLVGYLAECAGRMQSDKATNALELRDVLPWTLGFDKTRGNALNTDRDLHKYAFALAFLIRIHKGENPTEARADAFNEVFEDNELKFDDKTLQDWLKKVFVLKKKRPTSADWKEAAIKARYNPDLFDKMSRDFVVTFPG